MKKTTINDYDFTNLVNVTRLVELIEQHLINLYGHASHNTRDRKATDRRAAYYKCLIDTGKFSLKVISLVVQHGLKMKRPHNYSNLIAERKKAERFLTVRDGRFLIVYLDIQRMITEADKKGFSTEAINNIAKRIAPKPNDDY